MPIDVAAATSAEPRSAELVYYGQPGRDGSGEASASPADEVVAEIAAAGGHAVAHHGDVRRPGPAPRGLTRAFRAPGPSDLHGGRPGGAAVAAVRRLDRLGVVVLGGSRTAVAAGVRALGGTGLEAGLVGGVVSGIGHEETPRD